MELSNKPKSRMERMDIKKFKEDLISGHDKDFKDSSRFKNLKDKINEILKTHFDPKAFEKDQKERARRNAKSRFDKKAPKKKKLIGILSDFNLKLGLDSGARALNGKILTFVTIITILLSLIITMFVILNHKSLDILIMFLISIWTLVFLAIYLLSALILFMYLDIRMYRYVREIEEYLPDFLQLASANISAGMTVDRALWYAVRSKYGILAVEMENVAKATIAGEDLESALHKFGRKYDSRMLKETINLIVEGIQSGGEMADLLNKLSTNIKETQLMRKEIAASVTTYAIFIGVATVLAAPALFALSTELLTIIQQIFGSIQMDNSAGMSGMFSFNFSGESIKISDFKKFAVLVLVISSFFSAAIIGVIRKGSVKDSLKTIPIFIVVSLALYFIAVKAFAVLLGGLF
jgi:archaeal flagellar protein FlaJ